MSDPAWPGRRILCLHTKRLAPSIEISTRNKLKHVNVTVIGILIVDGKGQLCAGLKRSFKPYYMLDKHDSVKETGENAKKQ